MIYLQPSNLLSSHRHILVGRNFAKHTSHQHWEQAIDQLHPSLAPSDCQVKVQLTQAVWECVLRTWHLYNMHLHNDARQLSLPNYWQAVTTLYEHAPQPPWKPKKPCFNVHCIRCSTNHLWCFALGWNKATGKSSSSSKPLKQEQSLIPKQYVLIFMPCNPLSKLPSPTVRDPVKLCQCGSSLYSSVLE